MEKLFVETKYSGKIELPKELIELLPEKVMLCTTVQLVEHLREVKRKLEAYGKKVFLFNSGHGRYPGQILGCDNFKVSPGVEGFLYIGDGEFHPRALLANEKPVFGYNPFSHEIKKWGKKEWEEEKLRKKVGLMKFHSASKVGVLVSVKEGQYLMQKEVERLEKKFPDKTFYFFLGNEINERELENFNFIDCWVNTACPRIKGDVKGMVNLKELDF